MPFDLRIIELSAKEIEAIKPAVFRKIADSLPKTSFKAGNAITVSELIQITQPYIHNLQPISPPFWWQEIPEPPKQFGQRLHSLLSDSFELLRKQEFSFFQSFVGRSPEDIESVLFPFLYDRLVLPLIKNNREEKAVQLNLMVGMALQEWTKHVGAVLSHYPSNESFNAKRFFIASELSAKAKIEFPIKSPRKTVQVIGKIDALLFDYVNERLLIYEYKSGRQNNYIAQIIQCILYHELLVRYCGASLNLAAILAVFCLIDSNATPRQPERHSQDAVPPKSIDKEQCNKPKEEADALIQSIVEALNGFSLSVTAKDYVIGPRFIQLQIEPRGKTTVSQIKSRREDLFVKMNLKAAPLISSSQGCVAIEVERAHPDIVYLDDSRFKVSINNLIQRCCFPLGLDVLGEAQWIDLADSNCCHLLIGGTTGSGKSVFIQSAIFFLQQHYDPSDVRLLIIDPKRVTYNAFEHSKHLLNPIICSREEAIKALESFVEEMDARYSKFKNGKVTEITSWNEKYPRDRMPRWIMIFDEYADYMADKIFKATIESSIERLGFMARAAGIHLIIALQRPDAKTVSSRIKSNLPGRISFRVASHTESKIILDETGAENLLGKGDMLVKLTSKLMRIQAPFIDI
ncbi:MAG: DNA translocase FtsK [Candidatus Omnitrophota bacterium]